MEFSEEMTTVIERLMMIEKRYLELNEELMNPEIISNVKETLKRTKEQAMLKDAYDAYQKYKQLESGIKDAKEMLHDEELGEMAREELNVLEQEKSELEKEIEVLLLPKDPMDGKNVIVEIRGAAGGDEANIFAGDLFRMYSKYAEKEGWKIEILEEYPSEMGGYSLIQFMIKGENVYSKLKYESGAHRVQRVPQTETQGRVHTSTATVLVMPEADEVDIEIKEADLKVDVYRSSGAGGQHVNKTESAVRITHLPTGIVVTCQNERSQIQNRERAMEVLKNKLYQLELAKREEQMQEMKGDMKKIDFGSQIRSYVMHPYSLVKDHRTNVENTNVEAVLDGSLDLFINAYLKKGE